MRFLSQNDPLINDKIISTFHKKSKTGYIDIEDQSGIDKEEDKDDNKEDDKEDDKEEEIEWKFDIIFDSLGVCIKNGNNIWKYNLIKTKQFIDTNKKRPSSESKNIQEKRLGKWISHNNTNTKDGIRKHCMKNDEIYNLWCEFLEEYREYIR